MPIIADSDLVRIRRKIARDLSEIGYDKAAINAAIQSLEDWYEGARGDANAGVNAATDAAGKPRLSGSVKKLLGGGFLAYKAAKELE